MLTNVDIIKEVERRTREMREENKDIVDRIRETHYKQHQWIGNVITWTESVKSSTLRTIVQIIVVGLLGLIVLGFSMKNGGG